MPASLEIAQSMLLEPAALGEANLDRVMDELLRHRVDHADLYFQAGRLESWALEEGIIREGSYSIERGVGVRAVSGEKTGFAYTDEIQLPSLLEAARTARAIAAAGQQRRIRIQHAAPRQCLYRPINPLQSLSEREKIGLLRQIDAEARAQDPRVTQVTASLVAAHDVVLVLSSDGTLAADVRPLVRCNVHVIVEHDGRREQGSSGGGARQGLDYLLDAERALRHAREAVRQALVNLDAQAAPAGTMPVVLGPGWPGVLLHEAVGHGLEGDFNRKGTSAFSGRTGEAVASGLCTVVDDGTLPGRRGSLTIDDEGTPGEYTVLIEEGILKGYMQDKLNARLTGTRPTGNGRRESYAHLPMPRMTNTYMLPGEHDPGEIIASVERGLYAVNFGGGQVDITSGKFVFSASEAYLIENGRIGPPVKGATLIGNGPEVLKQVSMVGNDLALDEGVGTCGKEGQSVPVGVGQPTLKVDQLTVGGTSA
ncbi:MAG: metalloprotease TldD [Candidatus Sedimenticola endophacoides]|uniref:Metalloprotease TldD n=1 Tax=Candidatus Sedimenticola endophacoides TaxID=2548426 RepID=A0A657PY73_9GAMM|nr:MAG: metalloprotease TldD [Candidatus Sedimenticola endophacoides]OQX36278.1 MAG: metalloprotease TldD [Candidatus Sedimenticola endophacoides]OQX39822.1 MAG: metalloprotease TldD [Candidatus Sedimenticola endophacoides]OQX45419.1 MAG: metalloprotease TldD [Candidatus Sedimenticola endophacoides]OQX48189.1 MAG: metalloprotease TldD [Candidatus Sedimenticola endophacoides]